MPEPDTLVEFTTYVGTQPSLPPTTTPPSPPVNSNARNIKVSIGLVRSPSAALNMLVSGSQSNQRWLFPSSKNYILERDCFFENTCFFGNCTTHSPHTHYGELIGRMILDVKRAPLFGNYVTETFSHELERVRPDCARHGKVSSDIWIYTWLLDSINSPIFARKRL